MSYRDQKASPVVEVMGPEVHTIFEFTAHGRFEVSEHRDIKGAQAALRELRENNPDGKYRLQTEERPDLAPNTPLRKFQPAGWKL